MSEGYQEGEEQLDAEPLKVLPRICFICGMPWTVVSPVNVTVFTCPFCGYKNQEDYIDFLKEVTRKHESKKPVVYN